MIAALHQRHEKYIREQMNGPLEGCYPKQLVVEAGKTSEIIPQATVAICVSGSVSLELLAARIPSVMVFSLSGFAYVVQSWARHCKSFTLVNLLAMSEPIGSIEPVFLATATTTSRGSQNAIPGVSYRRRSLHPTC